MTIREYHLASQGHERQQQIALRREAGWMAMILNSQYSNAEITPGQLLGEKPPKKNTKRDLQKAERKLATLLAKRAGK